jgi:hypothetical protein
MDRKKNLETCLVVVTGLLIIFLFKKWDLLLFIAAAIGLIGLFFNKPSSWITWLWYKIGDILGKFVSSVILSITYFIFLFPISLLYRLTTNDKMKIEKRNRKTMWHERGYSYSKDDLKKPW